MFRLLSIAFAVLLLSVTAALADPRQLEVFTSFEPPDTGPIFGSPSAMATFSGGSARIIGVPSLYHSGSFSREVPAGVTTVAEFSDPAQVVEFFALDTGAINSTVIAFDASDSQIGQFSLTNSFSSPPGNFSIPLQFTGAVAKLEFRNPGSGSAWIDDFGFSPLAATVLPGDYNGNDIVDAADYTVWRDTLGHVGEGLAADGDDDGVVDDDDYLVWTSNFGLTAATGVGLAERSPLGHIVPEPAAIILIFLGVPGAFVIPLRTWSRKRRSKLRNGREEDIRVLSDAEFYLLVGKGSLCGLTEARRPESISRSILLVASDVVAARRFASSSSAFILRALIEEWSWPRIKSGLEELEGASSREDLGS